MGFWLSDEARAVIAPHPPRGRSGKPRVDDRRVVGGIPHVLKTGCRWRDRPAEYGPATTIYDRCNGRSRRGPWRRPFERVAASGPAPQELLIDGSHVKAHRSAAAPRRSIARPMIGADRSRSRRPPARRPTSARPRRRSAPPPRPGARALTRPTTRTARAAG